ncbi:MAG: hypothetical protein ACT4P7_22950 [Gemmatimonadaceae bacterium]
MAAGLREHRERGADRVLGAPWRFRFEETIEGEVADDVVGELIELARREIGLQGRVNEALGTVEWTGRDTFGATYVTVTRRGGRTTIGVLSARSDAAALTGVFAAVGAVVGSIGLGVHPRRHGRRRSPAGRPRRGGRRDRRFVVLNAGDLARLRASLRRAHRGVERSARRGGTARGRGRARDGEVTHAHHLAP